VQALPAPDPADEPRLRFSDVTDAAGLNWGIRKIAVQGWNLVETMGGGGGFVDFDGDGWPDIYLVSYSLEAQPGTGKPVGDALFRNNHDGTFTDVSAKAGISGLRRGMGLAVGDYDNDGRPDIFVSGYDTSVLYHNEGGGRFREVTDRAGVRGKLWGCSASFLDYDRDGKPDLFVSNYLEFDPERPGKYPCRMYDDYPFCSIGKFVGQPSNLFRNKGDGTFEDVSTAAGVSGVVGKGMAVVAADLDDDGWVDVFQTNDSAPNFLFRNEGGRFREVALEAEVAFDPSGQVTGAMGTDAEDVDGDGRLDLLVTNFNHYGTFLHVNTGGMRFADRGSALGLSMPTFNTSVFGARFLDVDNDGFVDLFMASGHPFAPVSKVWPGVNFSDPPFLFRNDGRRFANVAPEAGEALRRPHAGRGVAVGDFDNDGYPDLLVLCMGEPPRLFHNDSPKGNHWVGLQLVGTRSGRDAVGARVTLTAAGRARTRARVGGGSYLTASDPRLLFGLGQATSVDSLEVRWPSGLVERFPPPAIDRYTTLREGSAPAPRGR
jgi:hypothetical protein